MLDNGMPLADRIKAKRLEQLLFDDVDIGVHAHIITRPPTKSNQSANSPSFLGKIVKNRINVLLYLFHKKRETYPKKFLYDA